MYPLLSEFSAHRKPRKMRETVRDRWHSGLSSENCYPATQVQYPIVNQRHESHDAGSSFDKDEELLLATAVHRLPTYGSRHGATGQRVDRVFHAELAASRRVWSVGYAATFRQGYRESGAGVAEADLTVDGDVGISIESYRRSCAVGGCDRQLGAQRP